MGISIPQLTLNDGMEIPAVGFGTFRLKGNEGVLSILSAIRVGYRLFDSAYNYENEGTIGEVVRRSNVPREELLITSKLPGRYHEYELAVEAIQESLFRANLNYYDLYLIHWPNPITDKYLEAWQALIDAKKWGLIRSIGVCNFLPEHMERLQKETGVLPSINQIELHPYFNQQDIIAWHQRNDVQTQSWSPLGRLNGSLNEEIIRELSLTYEKTPAQIVLRWHFQLGSIAIPKSASYERQRENISLFDFELCKADMEAISSLSRQDGRNKSQDPAVYEEF